MDFSTQFARIQPAVLQILAVDANIRVVSLGSGVLIGDGTLALTCDHCIPPDTSPLARTHGSTPSQGTPGIVVAQDPKLDLALLRFPNPLGPAATLRSSSTTKVGQFAFVGGFPLSSTDIVAMAAHIAGFEASVIKIDSSVNVGNSGGPLFNAAGEVIGIINAKHGKFSAFLNWVMTHQPGAMMSLGGLDPVEALQQLIAEMQCYLNLGIGYAVPIDAAGSVHQVIKQHILPA